MENKFCLKSKKELDEIREVKNQLVGPTQEEAKFKVGDKVKVNGKNGTIKTVTPMKLSATPAYKIELEDNTVVYRYEEEIAESKINEISDETVYNATAKAHDRLMKLRASNDPEFDKNLDKYNRLMNKGLRREWRKAGLEDPRGISAKKLGKVWDKDYAPVYDKFHKNVRDNLKLDAFGNEKNESKINEISDELKNKVTAMRRADFNKANAEYDRASAKEGVAYGAPETDKALDKSYQANVKLQKNLKLRANDWREKLDGDEFVTLKDGRKGTLGGVVYDKDNNFVGYEFSTNPYGGYEYEEIKPEDIASLAESKINEGAGAAVTIYFDHDPSGDYNIKADITTISNENKITLKNILIADYYHGAHAYDGGYILFEEDAMKEAFVYDYNEYSRNMDDPEITVNDIESVYLGGYDKLPPIVFGGGWIKSKCEFGTVLDWSDEYYMPQIEINAIINGEEERTITECNGKYYPSDEACVIISDPEDAERAEYGYEDEEYDESLTAEKALAKSKTILEEYGEYKDDPNFEEIANALERGNTYGSTYEAEWGEVEINGTPISDLLKTDEVIDWVLRELSYPVRDGHAYYNGLDCIFYSYGDTLDHTNEDVIADLVALGFDEDLIREMPVIKDPADVKEIETWIDYDINYKEPEKDDEDEEYDESLSEAKVKPETLKAQLEEEIKKFFKYEPDALDWAFVEITKEEGRTRVEVRAELDYNGMWALSDALDPVVKKYDEDAYFDQEQPGIMTAYIENKKGLGERKIRSHRRKAIAEAKSKKMPKGDLILKLVHQVTKNDKGESAHVKYDWDKKEYNIEDQETGEILVSGKPNDIIKWAESKGAKQPAKDPGFAIDGAETLDQVYIKNWNRAMSKMAKNESAETRWGYDSYGYVEIEIPVDYIHSIAQSGDNAEAVKEALNDPFIANQFKDYSDEAIEKCFDYLGFDMTDAEVDSLTRREKEEYILWDFAWHLLDDDMDESKIDENKRWDSFAGHSLPNGDRDDYEETTEKEQLKSMVIPFSFKNPDQYSPADRINHKLVITREQDGTFSWSESSNDESGVGFKSAREAFDNAVSTGEFPLEDYDGFQLDAEVDLATFFNESKINESAESNWEQYDSGLVLANQYIQLIMPIDIEGMELDLVAWIFRNKENAKSKYGFELFVDSGADSTIIEDGNYDTVSEVIADCLSAIKEFDERNKTDIIYDVKPLEPNEADVAFLEKSV